MTLKQPSVDGSSPAELAESTARRHLRFGWWALAAFLTLGIALEGLHGFKVGYYLDVGNEARRLTWRLAHAHGTLFSIVNIVFALSLPRIAADRPLPAWVSGALIAATLVIPFGFFLGGLFISGGDPGIGVLLVPIGAVLLLAAVVAIARHVSRP